MSRSEQEPLLPNHVSEQSSRGLREKTAHFLEAPPLHWTVVCLTIVDLVCVVADLAYTFLSPGCGTYDPDTPVWLDVLAKISIVTTTLFLVEIPLDLFAFGLDYYNPCGERPMALLHLFDAFVIILTFILEVVLQGREREIAGLLIIGRLWRLVKLVGGVAVSAGQLSEDRIKDLQEAETELKRVQSTLNAVREENFHLRQRLRYSSSDIDPRPE